MYNQLFVYLQRSFGLVYYWIICWYTFALSFTGIISGHTSGKHQTDPSSVLGSATRPRPRISRLHVRFRYRLGISGKLGSCSLFRFSLSLPYPLKLPKNFSQIFIISRIERKMHKDWDWDTGTFVFFFFWLYSDGTLRDRGVWMMMVCEWDINGI